MAARVLSGETTLAVVLGAKEWPGCPGLETSEAFAASGQHFKNYLCASSGLRLPAENVKDCFDDPRAPAEILKDIGAFLAARQDRLERLGRPATDLLFYFVGHGDYVGSNDTYCLFLRFTQEQLRATTGLPVNELAEALFEYGHHLRRYLIIDACFAAAASRFFLQSSPGSMIQRQIRASIPRHGVALLCSSSRERPSKVPLGGSLTMFTGALLEVLAQGDPRAEKHLSLRSVCGLTKRVIRQKYLDAGVWPEVHSPNQQDGDIADIPLFPNPASRACPSRAEENTALAPQVFHATEDQLHYLRNELKRIHRDQAAADRRRPKRERIAGPIPSTVVQHFKDRVVELRSLREKLAREGVRLVVVCGRAGMGKTALITKLVHELQADCSRRSEPAPLKANRVVYVALRQAECRSPDTISELICRTLEPEVAAELRAKWQEKSALPVKLEFLFRRTLGARRCLIILDNLEDVLDDDNHVRADCADLQQFLEKCLEYDTSACVLATSRRALVLAPELEGRLGARREEFPLDSGLPESEAITLLRELDTDGRLGIRQAAEADLAYVAGRCHGIPRTLEMLVGVLRQRRTFTLAQLLANEQEFHRLMDDPVRELYESLSLQKQLVLQALAIHDRPVPAVAVGYLLPGLRVQDALDALVRDYVVSYDNERFSLHPLDQRYAYSQIPNTDAEHAKPALHDRAARFFRELRKPQKRWKMKEDLEPQLQEFYHLTRAGQVDDAARLLNPIDTDYLHLWGHSHTVIELREQLVDRLLDASLAGSNMGRLGILYRDTGMVHEAISYFKRALQSAPEHENRQQKGQWLGGLGVAYASLRKMRQAIDYYEQALAIARATSDRWGEGIHLGNMGLAYADLGQTRQALAYHEQALAIARETCDRRGEGTRLSHLGLAYADWGEMRRAVSCYEQALAIAREIGHRRGEAAALGPLAEVTARLGKFEESIRYCQEALQISRSIKYKSGLSRQLQYLGKAYHHLGNLAEARRYYHDAMQLGVPATDYSCAVHLGILAHEEGDSLSARDYFGRAILACRALVDETPEFFRSLYALGLAYLGTVQPTEALTVYQKALSVCSAQGVVRGALQDMQLLQRARPPIIGLEAAARLCEQVLQNEPKEELPGRYGPD